MASSALFGSGGGQVRGVKNLVEFKAGKMTLKDKMVQPDKRKGLVYVYQSEDSLMHFCWKDRSTGIVEDDLMIFPDDIETKRITQCTTGRVYLMKFKSSNKKLFFWMQETETDKDEKNWRKVNDYLNNPPPVGSNASSASGAGERHGGASSAAAGLANAFGADFGGLGGSDLQSLLGSMSEQQLQMFLGGLMPVNSPSSNRSGSSSLSSNQTSRVQSTVPGSRAEPAAAVATEMTTPIKASDQSESVKPVEVTEVKEETSTQEQKIQLSDLQNILGNLQAPSGSSAAAKAEEKKTDDEDVMDTK